LPWGRKQFRNTIIPRSANELIPKHSGVIRVIVQSRRNNHVIIENLRMNKLPIHLRNFQRQPTETTPPKLAI